MDDETVQAVTAFALAWLHKSLDESPTNSVQLTTAELSRFVQEPGSTALALNYDQATGSVFISHIRLDDQKH